VCNAPSIAVDSEGTIYVPIGSSVIATEGGYRDANVGLYRLADGASSWEQIAVPQDFFCTPPGSAAPTFCYQIPFVATGPDDSVYLVATGQHGFSPQDHDALYRSTDGGENWELLPRPSENMPILDELGVGPDGRIWLGGGYVYYYFAHFILTSPDGGQTWSYSRIDPSQEVDTSYYHGVTDFAFHDGSTYIATVPAGGDAGTVGYPVGVYRSDNGGQTWLRLTEDNPSQEMIALTVAANGDIYHSQRGTIRRSTDGGANWQDFVASPIVPFINTLAIDYEGVLWAGTDDGLFRTEGPVAPASEPPTRQDQTADDTTTRPASETIQTETDLDLFKADCFAAGGAYFELANGAHGCLFPDGSELDCAADGSCQLDEPAGIIIASPRDEGR
jgi:photosystem II stability/assembly factor-like uncharacterized protein